MDSSSLYKWRLVFREVSSPTNERTLISTLLPPFSLTTYTLRAIELDREKDLWLLAVMNSFVFDFVVRLMGNLHLSTCYDWLPMPNLSNVELLNALNERVERLLMGAGIYIPNREKVTYGNKERLLLMCECDALVAALYELNISDLSYILKVDPDNPVGFWRVDQYLQEEQRQTTLTIRIFKHLKNLGISRFLQEGWELPDYVTEFDRPGIKIWQPEGGWEEAWAEAKSMLTEKEWKEFMGEIDSSSERKEQSAVHEKKEVYGQKKLEFE